MFRREEGTILRGGDLRWRSLPSAAELARASTADMAALLDGAVTDGPLEVTVVGDVVPDRVIEEVARTFGALPPRAIRDIPQSAAEGVAFPSPGQAPLVRVHAGRADQAIVLQAWPTTDFRSDPQAQRVLGVLGDILKSRLNERFRSGQGVTYSPFLDVESSDVFRGVGHLEAYIETNPANAVAFFDGLDEIVADLRDRPVSADELDRAKRPRVEQRAIWLQDKRYWLGALMRAHGNPDSFDAIRQLVSGTRIVTAEDAQAAARRHLVPDNAFRMIVKPADPADPAQSPANPG